MGEHPIQQPIRAIDIDTTPGAETNYTVGRNGVTRIEACQKSGLHADIPYVRVWKGGVCEAEFCQHNIVGVYFDPQPVEPIRAETYVPEGGWPDDHTGKPDCLCTECIPF